MKTKQIVAILGLIGLLATLILPFLNYSEDGQKIQTNPSDVVSTDTVPQGSSSVQPTSQK